MGALQRLLMLALVCLPAACVSSHKPHRAKMQAVACLLSECCRCAAQPWRCAPEPQLTQSTVEK